MAGGRTIRRSIQRARSGSILLPAAAMSILAAQAVPSSQRDHAASDSRPEASSPPVADIAVPRLQSADEAELQDLELVAQNRGWTIEEARQHRAASEAVGAVAVRLAREYPDIFVGSALSESPGGTPTLYVKGPAPDAVRELVAAAPLEIALVDNQPYSETELVARSMRLHEELLDQGHTELVTGYDIQRRGQLFAMVGNSDLLPSAAGDVLASLSEDLRSTEIEFRREDIVQPEEAFGGMRVHSPNCTSGWSVITPGGTTGVTTAGHCSVQSIVHPGHATHALTHQQQHLGTWGDVEWKTTTQNEPPYFYADASTLRTATELEDYGGHAVIDMVCGYGRVSNSRQCLPILWKNISCTDSDTDVTVHRMVVLDGEFLDPGDSGGGWSFSERAYGGHYGNCGGDRDTYSVADLFDEALGVSVLLK